MNDDTTRKAGIATGLSLLVPITLSTMAVVLLAPILPRLMDAFGHVPNADYLVPMLLTIPALCVALLSPIGGALGDYLGRRRLLIGALSVYGFVGIAPVFLDGLVPILISRVLVGIAEALIMVLSTTLIGDFFTGATRDKWLAGQTAFASLSALLFFNVGGLLGGLGWRAPFWVYGSALLMLVAVLLFTWEPQESRQNAGTSRASWAGFPWSRMLGIIVVTIVGSVLFYTVQIQAAGGLVAHGLTSPARIGLLTSIASIGVPVGTYIYGKLPHNRVGWLLGAEFLILGIGFVTMSMAHGVPGFLVGCAINQLGAGLLLPTLLVWAVSQLPFAVRGRGIGLWQSAFALGQFLSPIVVTFIAHRTGALIPSFQWLGYAGLVAAACAIGASMRPAPRLWTADQG